MLARYVSPPFLITHPWPSLSKDKIQVDKRTSLPIYAIGVTAIINLLLALISLVSKTGFDAFISLIIAAYYSAFIIAAGVMLHKRLTTPNSEILWGPFRLGRAGTPITILALAYSVLGIIFSMWPIENHPTPETMNYCILVFGSTLIFSVLFWLVHGRKTYTGPIIEI